MLPYLARTLILNFGYNDAKDLFANPTGREHEQIRYFCSVKCLISWNLDALATVCRERCGGGSYLSSAGINNAIEGAHSGMTAEGDNRVLMQKVVKDIMSDSMKDMHRHPKLTQCPARQIPALKSINNLETLINLIYYKDIAETKQF